MSIILIQDLLKIKSDIAIFQEDDLKYVDF